MAKIKNNKLLLITAILLAFLVTGCGANDSPAAPVLDEEPVAEVKPVEEAATLYLEAIVVKGPLLEDLPRQVGYYEDGSIYSDGNAGFIIFGPYLPVAAGEYSLIIKGAAVDVEGALLEVASDQGETMHASFLISDSESEDESMIITRLVTLDEPVELLEIRIFIYAENEIRIDGYEFVKQAF